MTSSEPPGYAPRGVYLITPALQNATASTDSVAEFEDDSGRGEGEDVGSRDVVKLALIIRNIENPTTKPIDKEIAVPDHLVADIVFVCVFSIRISGSKAILYKRKRLLI